MRRRSSGAAGASFLAQQPCTQLLAPTARRAARCRAGDSEERLLDSDADEEEHRGARQRYGPGRPAQAAATASQCNGSQPQPGWARAGPPLSRQTQQQQPSDTAAAATRSRAAPTTHHPPGNSQQQPGACAARQHSSTQARGLHLARTPPAGGCAPRAAAPLALSTAQRWPPGGRHQHQQQQRSLLGERCVAAAQRGAPCALGLGGSEQWPRRARPGCLAAQPSMLLPTADTAALQ